MSRPECRNLLTNEILDVAILGGGINGTSLFDRLRRRGYRVGLIDAGDFACGTSSASGMMVWGGLLYLRQFDLSTVIKLSRSRDRMVRELNAAVTPMTFRYCAQPGRYLQTAIVLAGLYVYWVLGAFRRSRPRILRDIPESDWLNEQTWVLGYEEAMLRISDARFVLSWIRSHSLPDAIAMNHCEVVNCRYDRGQKLWNLDARDGIDGSEMTIRARAVVNCAGAWTDRVNRLADIETPCRHAFSKGVYVGFERPAGHDAPLIFELGENSDVVTSVPWGPIALWGPTETVLDDIEGGVSADTSDLRFLLRHRARCLNLPSGAEDVVSVRCGVRSLAVDRDYVNDRYTLEISRRHRIVVDSAVPWISAYGGKLTGCMDAAFEVCESLAAMTPPSGHCAEVPTKMPAPALEDFPGISEQVPTVEWCMEHEYCCTLEDYLRRRTNIAQWVPREGLGAGNCHANVLLQMCMRLCRGDEARAASMFDEYNAGVEARFDRLVSSL